MSNVDEQKGVELGRMKLWTLLNAASSEDQLDAQRGARVCGSDVHSSALQEALSC